MFIDYYSLSLISSGHYKRGAHRGSRLGKNDHQNVASTNTNLLPEHLSKIRGQKNVTGGKEGEEGERSG